MKSGSTDTSTVLDLNPATLKIYVGGLPQDTTLTPGVMSTGDYTGCVQGVLLNNLPLGMWNFANGLNNDEGCYLRK